MIAALLALTMSANTLHDFTLPDIEGKDVKLSKFKGQVVLVVNVASKCGMTPQYEGLQKLYTEHKAKGLAILGFPANEFRGQEPGSNAEIKEFCTATYGVTFPMFSKIVVKGEGIHPLYQWLLETGPRKDDIEWNFAKFLVGKDGKVIARFTPQTKPDDPELRKAIVEVFDQVQPNPDIHAVTEGLRAFLAFGPDAIVALLDALAVDRVAVLGVSGGGPASYALAGRQPDRVGCLLQVDSLCLPMPPNRLERLGFSVRPMVALQLWLIDHFPGRMLKLMGSTGNPGRQETADRAALMRAIVQSVSDWPRMRVGYDNDEAQFATLGALPFAQIACPTLIVHGEADRSVPAAHAEHAHAAISGSQVRMLPDGRHVGFFLDPGPQGEALAWLRRHVVT